MAEGDEQEDSQRTEDPTPKKLEEARKRGQVPMSKEANTWLMLMVSTIVLAAFGPEMGRRFAETLQILIGQSWQVHGSPGISKVVGRLVIDAIGILGIPLVVLFIAAAAGPFMQIGPLFAPETITPKLDKLSPIQGFKRLFSKRSIFEFIKGVLKVGIISVVSISVLRPHFDTLDQFIDLPAPAVLDELMDLFIHLMIAVLTVLFLLAGLDLLFQRWTHMQQMRMSRQEIKDEYKQTEGDPHVRSRLRQVRMERARKRMMQNVPTATAVVTNPTHYAVALKYEPQSMDAPVCVAKGLDMIALKIREIAQANDVVIVENPPLARTLHAALDIDDVVPPEHYKAVAEVISYVFRLKKKL